MQATNPIMPRSAAELRRITTPTSVVGGQLEGYKRTYFDTADLATAATELLFFNQPRAANPQATNVETPGTGQMAAETWFQIGSIHVTPLIPAAALADPQVWEDVAEIIMGHDGVLAMKIQSKNYGTWRIAQCGAIGGLVGRGYNLADATVEAREYATNGVIQQGAHLDGSLWLPALATYSVALRWDAPITLSATRRIGVDLVGNEWRPVV